MATPLQLPQQEWEERIRKLRSDAEALGATEPSAAELMALAGEAVGLLWVGWSPEVIAASCRASLLAGVPVVAGLPLGQLVWDAEATVARLQGQGGGALKVVLQEPVAEIEQPLVREGPQELRPNGRKTPEPLAEELGPDGPAPEPTPAAKVAQSAEPVKKHSDHCPKGLDPEVWLNVAAMGERLGITPYTLRRMCRIGQLGPEGGLWVKPGRAFWFDAQAVVAHLAQAQLQEAVKGKPGGNGSNQHTKSNSAHRAELQPDPTLGAPAAEPDDTAPAELDRLLAEVRRLTEGRPELVDQLLAKAQA